MNLGLKKIAATKTLFKKCLNYTAGTFCQQCQPECRTSDSGWTVPRQMWQLVSRRTSSFAECCAVNILENLETWSQIALWVVALLEQWVLYGLTPEKSQDVAFRLDAVHAKRTFLNIAKSFVTTGWALRKHYSVLAHRLEWHWGFDGYTTVLGLQCPKGNLQTTWTLAWRKLQQTTRRRMARECRGAGLLLLVWRHHIRNNILKMCYRQSRRGVLRQNSRSARQ